MHCLFGTAWLSVVCMLVVQEQKVAHFKFGCNQPCHFRSKGQRTRSSGLTKLRLINRLHDDCYSWDTVAVCVTDTETVVNAAFGFCFCSAW